MNVRTVLAATGVAAAAVAVWLVTTATAAPADDPADTGTVVITPEIGGISPREQRTPPPGGPTTDPELEAGIDQSAQDANDNTVPPTITVLGKG